MLSTNADTEMTDLGSVKTLEETSSEVAESRARTVFSTRCIKANTRLIHKLAREREHNKEACRIINHSNMKLKFEVAHAQRVIKSMLMALDTIRMANIDLEKECLIAKQKKSDIIERAQNGEKKYEDLWLVCKARYECLPYTKKLLDAKDELEKLQQKIAELHQNEITLRTEIRAKTKKCANLDRQLIVQLADFMINERPKYISMITEKSAQIEKLTKDLDDVRALAVDDADNEKPTKEAKNVETATSDGTVMFPKLMLGSLDFSDVLIVNHDKIQLLNMDFSDKKTNETKYPKFDSYTTYKNIDEDEYSYFLKPVIVNEEKSQNYAKKKLINILEDIKIDRNSALSFMNKVNPETLYAVGAISASDKNVTNNESSKEEHCIESAEIEETAMITPNADNLLVPPTQFMDRTLTVPENKSQEEMVPPMRSPLKELTSTFLNNKEGHNKKKVSFDLPNKLPNKNTVEKPEKLEKIDADETFESQLNVSAFSDDGFARMKEILMKKHNLDSSPQFVFAKNIMTSMNLQKTDEAATTSKFFQQEYNPPQAETAILEKITENVEPVDTEIIDSATGKSPISHINVERKGAVEMKVNYPNVDPNPLKHKINNTIQSTVVKTVCGYGKPRDGTQMTESPDVSISTMGYDDGETGFPHCIDSNLLLSPKADFTQMSQKPEKLTQNVPSFLSGMRKTGLSFFGSTTTEPKTDSSAQNQGGSGFSFNFSGDEKKTRGGLFSFFQ